METFRQYTGNLELIATMYNEVVEALLEVEKPLLLSRMRKCNDALVQVLLHHFVLAIVGAFVDDSQRDSGTSLGKATISATSSGPVSST